MKRLFLLIVSTLAFETAFCGLTTYFALDCRDGVRVANVTEQIHFSPLWSTNASGCSVLVSVNGSIVTNAQTSGVYDWTPSGIGAYTFALTTKDSADHVVDTETARFAVGVPILDESQFVGEFLPGGQVNLGSVPEGWTLHYTLDGSEPTDTSPKYNGEFKMYGSGDVTVRAVAINGAGIRSFESEKTFTLATGTCTLSQADGTCFTNKLDVALSSNIVGAEFRYTLDGSEPTSSSRLSSGTIILDGNEVGDFTTVKAVAVLDGHVVSPVVAATYKKVSKILSVMAQQHYPWNGTVDVVLTAIGVSNDWANTSYAFVATNSEAGTSVPLTHITRNGGIMGSGVTWVQRFVWDAVADLGNVEVNDLMLMVKAMRFRGVQLWENGPYWAECNVGATTPEEYGYYFWWGGTVGYKRNADNNGWISVKDGTAFLFYSENCPTYGKNNSQLEDAGYIDATGNLVAAHDAATANLGAPWHMPTDAEFSELINKCDTTWTTRGGVYGRLVTGRGAYASKCIFLPAADGGIYSYGPSGSYDPRGGYWSSTPYSDDEVDALLAWYLGFYSHGFYLTYNNDRYRGLPVRPLTNLGIVDHVAMSSSSPVSLDLRNEMDVIVHGENVVEYVFTGQKINPPYYTLICEDSLRTNDVVFKAQTHGFVFPGHYALKPDDFENTNTNWTAHFVVEQNASLTILPANMAAGADEPGGHVIPEGHVSAFDTECFYDGQGHTLDVAALEQLTLPYSTPQFSYAFSSNGPWQAEAPLFTNLCVTSVWYRVTATNYLDYVHEVRVTINPNAPMAAPQAVYTSFDGQSCQMSFTGLSDGATVYYTLDGSEPTRMSSIYSGPITLTDRTRVRAIAVKYGWQDSLELDMIYEVGAGVVDGNYGSVRARFPQAYPYLTNVTVAAGAAIDADYFAGCAALVKVSLPDRVAQLDAQALDDLPIAWDIIDGYKLYDGWLFGYTETAAVAIPNVDGLRGIADGALEECTALKGLVFSDAAVIHYIGARALKQATELQTLILPPSLEVIGDEAFMACSYLGNVIVPGSVGKVGNRAFKNCTGFTHAQVQYGVREIGEEAFAYDWRIAEVDLPSTVTNIGRGAFGGDSSIVKAGLRGDIRPLYEIFCTYDQIKDVTVKVGERALVENLFADCEALLSVRYQGNAPALISNGEDIYRGTSAELVSYVSRTSTGWDGTPGSHSLPRLWPLSGVKRAIEYWDVPSTLVRFDSAGGAMGVQDVEQYSEKPFALPPEPTRSGYAFAGWWTLPTGGLAVTESTVYLEGVYETVYAHWTRKIWVTFDAAGGTASEAMLAYVKDAVYGELPAATRKGYLFGGWTYGDETATPNVALFTASDHTLVAHWTPIVYSIAFDANGGTGEMAAKTCTYDAVAIVPACTFTREGFAFAGWSTNALASVVDWREGDEVLNLAETNGAVVSFHALWNQDTSNLELSTEGDALWSVDSETHAGAVAWRSGDVDDNETTTLKATVKGAGKVSFWWKVDCEKYRTYKLDHLSFYVDGVEKNWINGTVAWTNQSYEVTGSGTHVLEWKFEKDEEGTDGEDCGWVSEVVWEPSLATLGDYLNTDELVFTTSGDAVWYGEKEVSHDGIGAVRSGVVGDSQTSLLETTVVNSGEISFWFKIDCEKYRTYKLDHLSFYVDGVERAWYNGVIDWTNLVFTVDGAGEHTLAWVYEKDEEGSDGEDCAWLDGVVWTPSAAPVGPSVEDDPGATVTGDASAGYVIKPSEGKSSVEVTIPTGVEPSKVTVEVSSSVETIRPNGASIKVVKGTSDITSYLDIPTAVNGVVNLGAADVKAAIVKEAMDPAAGAQIEINAENPSLTTSATKPGLVYTLREGASLESMASGDSKVGDGQPWTPNVTVKGGTSGFYSISVGK